MLLFIFLRGRQIETATVTDLKGASTFRVVWTYAILETHFISLLSHIIGQVCQSTLSIFFCVLKHILGKQVLIEMKTANHIAK